MSVEAPQGPNLTIPPEPKPGEYERLARQLQGSGRPGLDPLRIAILGSSTLDFLRPVLIVEGARGGSSVDLFTGEYGQLEQSVLDPASVLYAWNAEVLVLAFQPSHIAPNAFARYYASNGAELEAACDELIERLVTSARAFRERTGRPVLIANFATPSRLPLGPFDAGDPASLTHRMATKNLELARRAASEPDVYVWDYAGMVREAGAERWSDPRLELMARVTVAPGSRPALARHLLRTITAIRRPPAKCLVLDLDNTLWGGVVGDDGPENLQLGDDWPGSAFKAFQRCVLGLRDRGILLAVVSKNDESVAAQVFESHREMVIRWQDLAAVRINWEPKSVNVRAVAAELNIGTDALVFFDDNPVERAEVRAALPEVRVIEAPTDPVGFVDALLSSGHFDQARLSGEDRKRADMYRSERERSTALDAATSVEEFLVSLEMQAEVGTVGAETIARVAQLIGKTNQFNLTTRRHTAADVARMTDSPDFVVAWLRLRDRFGDQGLIGVGIVERRGDQAWLDTFLMSCRVMNRGVERAMMAYLMEHASRLGCRRMVGEYRPTPRNHMVRQLLPDLGFLPYGKSERGELWIRDLDSAGSDWPAHIQRTEASPVGHAVSKT